MSMAPEESVPLTSKQKDRKSNDIAQQRITRRSSYAFKAKGMDPLALLPLAAANAIRNSKQKQARIKGSAEVKSGAAPYSLTRSSGRSLAPAWAANYRNMQALADLLHFIVDGEEKLFSSTAPVAELNSPSGFFARAWGEDSLAKKQGSSRAVVSSAGGSFPFDDPKIDHGVDRLPDQLTFVGLAREWKKRDDEPEIVVLNTDWDVTGNEWVQRLQQIANFLNSDYVQELDQAMVVVWEPSRKRSPRRFRQENDADSSELTKLLSKYRSYRGRIAADAGFIRRFMKERVEDSAVFTVECGPMDFILIYSGDRAEELSDRIQQHQLTLDHVGDSTFLFQLNSSAGTIRRVPSPPPTVRKGARPETKGVHYSGEIEPANLSDGHDPSRTLQRKFKGSERAGLWDTNILRNVVVPAAVKLYDSSNMSQITSQAGYSWEDSSRLIKLCTRMLWTDRSRPEHINFTVVNPKLPTIELAIRAEARRQDIQPKDSKSPALRISFSVQSVDELAGGNYRDRRAKPDADALKTISGYGDAVDATDLKTALANSDKSAKDASKQRVILFDLDWGERQIYRNDDPATSGYQPDLVRYSQLESELKLAGKALAAMWQAERTGGDDKNNTVAIFNVPAMRTDLNLIEGTDVAYRKNAADLLMIRCSNVLSSAVSDVKEVELFDLIENESGFLCLVRSAPGGPRIDRSIISNAIMAREASARADRFRVERMDQLPAAAEEVDEKTLAIANEFIQKQQYLAVYEGETRA